MGPKSHMTGVLIRREEPERDTKKWSGKGHVTAGAETWSPVAASQEMSRIAGSHQKLRRPQEGCTSKPLDSM